MLITDINGERPIENIHQDEYEYMNNDTIIFVIMIIKIFPNIYYLFSHCYSDCYVQNTVSRSLTLVWRHNKNIDPLIPNNCRRSYCPKEDDVFADATAHDYNIPDYLS